MDTGSANPHQHTSALVIRPPPASRLTNESQAVSTPSHRQNASLSEEQKKLIEEVFKIFDTSTQGLDHDDNDSGNEDEGQGKSGLNESEFASAIKALGFSSRHHQKTAKMLMSKVDADGDNSVSLEEFTHLMEGQLTGRDPDEEIIAIFDAFVDYAENGRITKLRLAEVAEHVGVNLTDDELVSMFEGVNQKEFVQILKHSTWI